MIFYKRLRLIIIYLIDWNKEGDIYMVMELLSNAPKSKLRPYYEV